MKRGFMHVIEAYLAILLIYTMMNSVQTSLPAKFSDSDNIQRLHRYAQDFAFSLCNNEGLRSYFANNSLPAAELNASLPGDLSFRVFLYSNASSTHSFSTSINETGDVLVQNKTLATASCLVAGYANTSEILSWFNASACNTGGADCKSTINASDDSFVGLSPGQNFSVSFAPIINGTSVKLFVRAMHNSSSGNSSLWVYNGSQHVLAYNTTFSTAGFEDKVFDLTDFLPDSQNLYNVTFQSTVGAPGASYDYAYLNVTVSYKNLSYSPKKVTVAVWNKL